MSTKTTTTNEVEAADWQNRTAADGLVSAAEEVKRLNEVITGLRAEIALVKLACTSPVKWEGQIFFPSHFADDVEMAGRVLRSVDATNVQDWSAVGNALIEKSKELRAIASPLLPDSDATRAKDFAVLLDSDPEAPPCR